MSDTRLHISPVPLGPDRVEFLFYDLAEGRIVSEISDYAHVLLGERHNSRLTVEQGMNHLLEFWRYLLHHHIQLGAVSDRVIEQFRDENYKKVRTAAAHRGSANHAKATVNLKLYRIYDWLVWMQKVRRLPVGTVGHRGLVTALTEAQAAPRGRGSRWVHRGRKYPLLFKVANANSKHNAPATVVTDEHVSALFALFTSRHEPYIAQRNVLFADIAESTGFRRGSICSLRVDQFALEAIENSRGEFLVRPARQKFGYENTFAIGLTLAYRIRQFIDDYWVPWVAERKIPEKVHQKRLFLSAKSGSPITERAITQIVARGFSELGFSKGIGPHSLRGKFASEESDHQLAERKELGLDTSNLSIAAAMATKLGHNDPSQFYRYASSSQARQARIARDGRLAELNSLRTENKKLNEENAELRAELRDTRGKARDGR